MPNMYITKDEKNMGTIVIGYLQSTEDRIIPIKEKIALAITQLRSFYQNYTYEPRMMFVFIYAIEFYLKGISHTLHRLFHEELDNWINPNTFVMETWGDKTKTRFIPDNWNTIWELNTRDSPDKMAIEVKL